MVCELTLFGLFARSFVLDDSYVWAVFMRLCCTNPLSGGLPLSPDGLILRRCDGYAKSGVAVENGDADLDFRDLPIKVSCH